MPSGDILHCTSRTAAHNNSEVQSVFAEDTLIWTDKDVPQILLEHRFSGS